jgi:hypothetical protein
MGVGHLTPFAASARASCSRGGGSISLALTDVPSLSSFSPFTRGGGGVGVFGGGSGGHSGARTQWSPSSDRHAHGELRHFPLVLVWNDGDEFCLGCIGVNERRFCRSTACNVMSHRKRQYELECHEGFYIPTVITKFPKQPSAFRTPFLDASQLTPEVRAVITATGEHGSKTTSEWEEFIMQARVAWHVSLDDTRRRGQGSGIREGSNQDDASSESMISLPDKPGAYTFTDGPTFGNLKFRSDGKDDKEGRSTPNPTLLEIGMAIEELDQKMQAAMETIREDQVGIMDHLWVSILRLSSAARSVKKARIQGIEDVVGDAKAVLDEHTLGDLSEGLLMALG